MSRRTMIWLVLLPLLMVVQFACAAQTGLLRPTQCHAPSELVQSHLDASWQPYLKFVKQCDVKNDKAVVLMLVSVWVTDYEATLPPTAPAGKYPKPILMAPDGSLYGTLPMGYPDDPPRTLAVSFMRWEQGFPKEIRFRVTDPTVTGEKSAPTLYWNASKKLFEKSAASRKN